MRGMRNLFLLVALALAAPTGEAQAAGSWLMDDVERTEEPRLQEGSREVRPAPRTRRELRSLRHQVQVRITDGFARTTVSQVWANPNPEALEGTYELPLPERAALATMSIRSGETLLQGEVQRKAEAEETYQEEKDSGNDAGLAEQDGHRQYRFRVSRIPAAGEVRVDFTYYQPLEVDTGVVRYCYPVSNTPDPEAESGASSFWSPEVRPAGTVELTASVRSAWEIADLRVAGSARVDGISQQTSGNWEARATSRDGKDLVLYYRLAEDLPGRVEVHCYRPASGGTGTFMAILTPGVDLPLISETGGDHIFLLDISGSMKGTLGTLRDGVTRALRDLDPRDRFQLLPFDSRVTALTQGPVAADERGRERGERLVASLRPRGGTDLYGALQTGLRAAHAERATHLILVTDGRTNQGHRDRAAFEKLVRETDVRIHGFLLGDQANWPLMDTITKASGGNATRVSASDDLGGLLLLAREKLKSQALHDVRLTFTGAPVRDLTEAPRRLFHGQQLVVFGRYDEPGTAELTLATRISGKPQEYRVRFELPERDEELPELERLWAMARVDDLQRARDEGRMGEREADETIADLGVTAQIVTEQTSMVLLGEDRFAARGIERRNQARVAVEEKAQATRAAAPVRKRRVRAAARVFPRSAPNVARPRRSPAPSPSRSSSRAYRGGGALDPVTGVLLLGLLGLARREEDEA